MNKSDDEKKIYLELLNRISEQVDETQVCVSKLDKKLDLNIQEVKHEMTLINKLDEHQNELLAEHIKRTELAEARLDVVERPFKAASVVKNVILFIGSVSAAVYAVLKLLGKV